MTITERRDQVRATLPADTQSDRYVVIPNDAPAYQRSGAWGVYDLETCHWLNFRDTKQEAQQLLATLSQR